MGGFEAIMPATATLKSTISVRSARSKCGVSPTDGMWPLEATAMTKDSATKKEGAHSAIRAPAATAAGDDTGNSDQSTAAQAAPTVAAQVIHDFQRVAAI